MSVLLKDVLVIPETAGAEDYVLRLTDSVGSATAGQTIHDYVVTDSLRDAFDTALGLVAESVTSGVSRGAFLRGSFGSGKSHFMAVLHALLRHDPDARAVEALQKTVERHDAVLLERKVLPLAFHVLGADSLEQALFDGYLRQVRALHPQAFLPALHYSDSLLADAEKMRSQLGDEAFFTALNGGASASASSGAATGGFHPGWSTFTGGDDWTEQTYAAARAAAPGSAARQRLVTGLADTFFTSYTQQASYVDLDTGLAAISQHAKDLGYDAVVLFLDELVLWLAFAVRDSVFFRRESQKLTKLVESTTGVRPVPLISFVARQMDLRRWFSDAGASGAEQEALDQAFRHQEGRFLTVVLGDDNLPYVANKRLLRRRDDTDAEQVLTDAFARLDRRSEVWDVLLDGVNTDERHRGADEEAFRLTYPFSPALVSTLRSLAGAMQRERTALKVMQQMLVDRRDDLTVDDVIPVGDCFDYVVDGREAIDHQVAAMFRSATTLYREKLRPLILAANGLTEAELAADRNAATPAFCADDRLAKTLLLSAVADKVPALKELTGSRLASLNHGSIKAPLRGGEAGIVLTKVKAWARDVPEIHVDPETRNPVIRVQLSDVDYESVVERARGEDNDGRRRELLKTLVQEALGMADRDPDVFGVYRHTTVWRGSERTIDVVFGNVRDAGWLTDDHFQSRPGTWRFVVDYPFDEHGHSAAEDLARLDRMKDAGAAADTVVWLPRFLADARLREVRRLVVLDWLLGGTGERWTTHADHLPEMDRIQARAILETQRAALRDGIRRAVQEAYGAAAPTHGTVLDDASHDRVLISLSPRISPANPVGANLRAAFENLIDQAFSKTYPGHPRFEPEGERVTPRQLAAVYEHVERAVADEDGRVRLQGDVAAVRRIAGPLGIGTANEQNFLFGDDRFSPWGAAIERAISRAGFDPHDLVKAGDVRTWIEALEPKVGLRDEVADLVVLSWAALRQRTWFHQGGPIPAPKPGSVRPEMELRVERLPAPADWRRAVQRGGELLGANGSNYLTAAAVAKFVQEVHDRVGPKADAAARLVPKLEFAYRQVGLPVDRAAGRLAVARATASFLDDLRRTQDRVGVVETLARTGLPGSDVEVKTALARADEVVSAVSAFPWGRLGPVREGAQGADARARNAARILDGLLAAVDANEQVQRLHSALTDTDEKIFRWVSTGKPAFRPADERRDDAPPPRPTAGGTSRAKGASAQPVIDQLLAFLKAHPDDEVVVEWRLER